MRLDRHFVVDQEDDVELKATLFLVNMSQKRQNGFAADSVCFAGLSVVAVCA